MATNRDNRCAELEQELQYYKEMYEIEKETNELNEIKLAELNSLNAQDRQRYERELVDLRAKMRRLENSLHNQKSSESAVASLTERVRIAENAATKLEEDCRVKDFKIREQQKDYDLCLSKCNALELMVMTTSQIDGSISINHSVGDPFEGVESPSNGHLRDEDKHSPNTDTTCDTLPESPAITTRRSRSTTATTRGPFISVPKFVDINGARAFCEEHSDNVEALLLFADMIRSVRSENHGLKSSRSMDSTSGRIPLAVIGSLESIKDLQRRFAELAPRPNA
ncbi:hypothetical protein M3Y99_00617600 [Aphelenchoides fujianensis]|nr:hypothetical protein M3Y99_00617600 [Aphelenchoides fujianensis]